MLCLCLLASCAGSNTTENETVSGDIRVDGDTLTVTPNSATASKLATTKAVSEMHEMTISTTGEVTAIPTAYAEVAPPFAGRITKSLVHIGQSVSVGTPLFELYSADYSEVVKNYLQSVSQMEAAKSAYNRIKDLHANKVASAKELEEAQMAYSRELEEYRHAMAVAKEYQIDLKHAEVGQPMIVRSPIAGKVLRNDLVMGEYVKDDADAKVVVADLRKVWVKANVTEMEAPLMSSVEEVEIRLVSNPDSSFGGKIAYTGGMLDPETRTMQTIIECDNAQGRMLPNMYAKIRLKTSGRDCIIVPKKAVLQGEGSRYVLRKIGENRYLRTKVQTQTADEERLIITDGIDNEDEIVTEGAFLLIDSK